MRAPVFLKIVSIFKSIFSIFRVPARICIFIIFDENWARAGNNGQMGRRCAYSKIITQLQIRQGATYWAAQCLCGCGWQLQQCAATQAPHGCHASMDSGLIRSTPPPCPTGALWLPLRRLAGHFLP